MKDDLKKIKLDFDNMHCMINNLQADIDKKRANSTKSKADVEKINNYLKEMKVYLKRQELRFDKDKANFAKVEWAVNKEIKRLKSESSWMWPGPNLVEINYALNRLQYLINKTNGVEHPEQGPLEKNSFKKYRFEDDEDLDGRNDDLCREQFKKSSYCSIEQMLNFKLRLWVKPFTYTTCSPGDDDFSDDIEVTIPGKWRELPSIKEALSNKVLGINVYTLWGGRSRSQINVEKDLSDQRSFLAPST